MNKSQQKVIRRSITLGGILVTVAMARASAPSASDPATQPAATQATSGAPWTFLEPTPSQATNHFSNLSLEDLMDVKITSVSKQEQLVSETRRR